MVGSSSLALPLTKQELDRLEAALRDKPIQGKVTGTNKGGYEVRIGSLNAFAQEVISPYAMNAPPSNKLQVLDFMVEELNEKKLKSLFPVVKY